MKLNNILIAIPLIFTSLANAGFATGVAITKLGSGPLYSSSTYCGSDCVLIKTSSTSLIHPACATNTSSWDFALDTSTTSGMTTYSHLLAAHISKDKSVSIYGTGSCVGNAPNLYEELNYMTTD